jgi:drug/metabolite transporter (DMT)-like permease
MAGRLKTHLSLNIHDLASIRNINSHAISFILLNEILTIVMVFGALLIIIAIVLVSYRSD